MGLGLAIGSLLHDVGDPAPPPHLAPLPLDLLGPGQQPAVMAVLYGQVVETQGLPLLRLQGLGFLAPGAFQGGPKRNYPGFAG